MSNMNDIIMLPDNDTAYISNNIEIIFYEIPNII